MAEAASPALGKWREPNNLHKLSRSPKVGRLAIVNHFNRTVDGLAATSRFPRLRAFLSKNIWPWISSFMKYYFAPRVDFPTYKGRTKNGVYNIVPPKSSDKIRIAIAGDWGTGTLEAYTIAKLMESTNPDFTIHVGDVYYVGDEPEIQENCLGKPMNGHDGVNWPKGSRGSFALNGNHEMYAKGGPYFNTFLRTLGTDDDGQIASFFCLEIAQWRILALDTGYNSAGVPILSAIPFINTLPFAATDCHLEDALVDWMRNVVKLKENPKPTMILSHHQYFTAFPDSNYTKPARQLAEFFQGREFIWLWGHEHRLGIYRKWRTGEGLTLYGRCIGHGGMPVEIATPDTAKAPIMLYDTRSHKLSDGSTVGQNGFATVDILGDVLTIKYHDVANTLLFSEEFSPAANGALNHTYSDPGILKSS